MALHILHVSDLHIGKTTDEQHKLITIVDGTKDKWGKDNNKPLVLITGDITNDATEAQFKLARTLLDPLYASGFQLLLVPGNHDYGPGGTYVVRSNFELFRTAFSEFFPEGKETTYPLKREINGHVLLGLDSMQGHAKGPENLLDKFWADGDLGHAQTAEMVTILESWKGRNRQKQKVIVYLHHHPFPYPDEKKWWKIFGERVGHALDHDGKFMRTISDRVDLLLSGHEHRHLDFSNTEFAANYKIPTILSAGQSTDETTIERTVGQDGKEDKKSNPLHQGLLGRLVTIQDDGAVKVETIKF